ncbi:MAG: DNA repair protein RadC [Crocinitomicaceae bacterium]|nr:DNA repair protein RadC [Crocinitomicaceae bacterium]
MTVQQNIKTWAPEDRPREKLILRGSGALSDAELLAILIGTGTKEESAVGIARRILSSTDNDLSQLARLTLADFGRFRGIGKAKGVLLLASLELGRRRRFHENKQKKSIRSSQEVYEYFVKTMGDLSHEECWVMFLTRSYNVISLQRLSEGGTSSTIIDPKRVFSRALEHRASALIVAHNHPSGALSPSQEDKNLTKKLMICGRNLELPLLDHLIVTNNGYFSFADEGILDAE